MIRATLVLFALIAVIYADEIAFVDVFSDDAISIRSLDVPISTARGTDNFFLADPMESHDWTNVKRLRASLAAEREGSMDGRGAAAARIATLEKELQPLFEALPRNQHHLLGNGTARYALHRLFRKRYGWSLKGLEPAGGAWVKTMSVTHDVKQTSKYLVPTFLHGELLAALGEPGMSLRAMAILAATLEHLIRAELTGYLHSMLAALGLRAGGYRSEQEAEEIVDAFLLVYAFGVNLEVSDHEDLRNTKAYLDEHHAGWRRLRSLAQGVRKDVASDRRVDFDTLVKICSEIGARYASFQDVDCGAASQRLAALPGGSELGSVSLEDIEPLEGPGHRSLFGEEKEVLQRFGVLDSSTGSRLVVPNYLASHLMCLTTASFYTVCCRDACEEVIEHLESALKAPAAQPDAVESALGERFGSRRKTSASLEAIAAEQGGVVRIHSRAFALWLHEAFPLKCPAPQENEARLVSPRTADEWMEEDCGRVEDTEQMMGEISDTISRYASLGRGEDEVAPVLEVRRPRADDVIFLRDSVDSDVVSSRGYRLRPIFYAFAVLSFLAAVCARGTQGVEAACPSSSGKSRGTGCLHDFVGHVA